MTVRARLIVAFLVTALLVPGVGVLAVRQAYDASERAAQIEAKHVAEPIAHLIANTAELSEPDQPQLFQQPRRLQEYISDLHRDLRRDIVVVDPGKRILADAIPANQGQIFTHDTHGEISATIGDGHPRTFTERSPDFPDGIQQVVIALRSETGGTVGAVIMEYTPIYRELVAAGAGLRRLIMAVSVAGLALALLLGYLLARGIVRDLRALGQAADRLADGHDGARAQLRGRDELAQLATTFNNMAARIAAQKAALTEVAISDPLTGLHNRRSFQVRLAEEVARADRSGEPFSLLLLDLDHFKTLNDHYGHPAGDQALRHVAAVLKRELRVVDLLARIGGEEFAVLLPATSDHGAVEAAERLRGAVAGQPAAYEGVTLPLTASIGVAWYPAHADTDTAIIRVADQALYQAKRTGRNRTATPTAAAHK